MDWTPSQPSQTTTRKLLFHGKARAKSKRAFPIRQSSTRGPSRKLVKIENLERLGKSDPEIMAYNASHRGTRDPEL